MKEVVKITENSQSSDTFYAELYEPMFGESYVEILDSANRSYQIRIKKSDSGKQIAIYEQKKTKLSFNYDIVIQKATASQELYHFGKSTSPDSFISGKGSDIFDHHVRKFYIKIYRSYNKLLKFDFYDLNDKGEWYIIKDKQINPQVSFGESKKHRSKIKIIE